ncbi:MAG: hypothetical protein ACK41Q_01835 [Candidatus Brocadia sp.]
MLIPKLCLETSIETPPVTLVGQASTPDIMMTGGDACPTNGEIKSSL